jgi:hypothetical protein
MITSRSLEEIDRLILARIPESPSLEYKQDLALDPATSRLEALKDLSGLGNGGGATIIYGVAKDPKQPDLPSHKVPLTDPAVPGRLEDIVRAGIRPPLLALYHRIPSSGGEVLAIEITRSPLGPYMVEGYGERRYYMRIGSRTEPMSEQQIRDAYLLAARARERRPLVWLEHELPLKPLVTTPCLCVTGLPEEPLQELLEVGSLNVDDLQPPAEMGALRKMAPVPRELRTWARGLYGETRTPGMAWIRLRLYRDGAIGSAVALPAETPDIPPVFLARTLHAQLAYLGRIWDKVGLRNLVELRLDLQQIEGGKLDARGDFGGGDLLAAHRPGDTTSSLSVSLSSEELPGSLSRAGTRHRLVKRFMDQVYQAYGRQTAPPSKFTMGWLYGSDGNPLGLSVVGAGLCRGTRGDGIGRIYSDGYVMATKNVAPIGHLVDGVLLDPEGNAIAAVEMALGSGIPDDFVVQAFTHDALYSCLAPEPLPAQQLRTPPPPTGTWSGRRLTDFL